MNPVVIGVVAGAYVLGSWNFAITTLRLTGHGDPRAQHSGNAGVSNVARIAGRGVAAVVLLLDLGRAVALQFLAALLCPPEWVPWAGLALVAGNRFPLWHGLRGGKGVANYLGFVAAAQPVGAAIACLAWLAGFGAARKPWVGSMLMLAALLGSAAWTWPWTAPSLLASGLTGALIVLAHVPNFRNTTGRT